MSPSARMMGLFDRYAQAWASRDPDAIVALHTEQSVFHLRLDRVAVTGRTALRAAFAELLAQWPKLGVEPNEVRYGTDFWVLDWTLTAELREAGASRRVRVDCLDLVTTSAEGLVARKDTFVDLVQAQRALQPVPNAT